MNRQKISNEVQLDEEQLTASTEASAGPLK